MRTLTTLIFLLATASSTASYTFAADNVTTEAMIQKHQKIVERHTIGQHKSLPAIIEYTYAMDLDIVKIVRVSPDTKACRVMPQLMTYEDSKGELNTLQYTVLSECRGKN